jgi:transposase
MGKIERIQVAPEDREWLVKLVKDRNTPQKIVWRSQIVLFAGEGIGAVEVATRVGKSVLTVRRWRRRYASKGVDGLLKDATRPPGRKPLTARKIKQVVNLTLNDKPPDATHWSERTMAARTGIAPSSVHKIWAAHGLKPHLSKTFKLSRDPNFVAKVEDIVGLYLNPPDKALVLAVDEKSQIQALDRTQPGLPMKKGRCGTMTHDYKRNGTTTCLRLSTCSTAQSSANACPATGIASSSAFSRPSTNGLCPISTCISSSTIMPPTRPLR